MKNSNRIRRGASLLEVMAATVLASLVLVPLGKSLADASRWANRMEYQNELVTAAQSVVEQSKYQLSLPGQFLPGPMPPGDLTAYGHPKIHYTVVCNRSTLAADADIANLYLEIDVRVWADLNSDGQWTSGQEPEFRTVAGFAKP
jgi:hypothetical protein